MSNASAIDDIPDSKHEERKQSPKKKEPIEDPELKQRQALLKIEHERILQKRRRQKKSTDQKEVLEAEYLKNPNWDYQKKCDLALALNYTTIQIAKWNWDRKKKDEASMAKKNKK